MKCSMRISAAKALFLRLPCILDEDPRSNDLNAEAKIDCQNIRVPSLLEYDVR